MSFTIIAVGHKMPDWVNSACEGYMKRMPREAAIFLKEIKPVERTSYKNVAQVMALEREKILAVLPKRATFIALDEKGKSFHSLELAALFRTWQESHEDIYFIIGGADGLDPTLKLSAHFTLSLSDLTLPHGMARVILIEQLYRAWSITQNHPYHRI